MCTKLKLTLVFLLSVFLVKIGSSQIIYTPYSLFGVGKIESDGFGVNKALGGTGIAFISKNSLNSLNPASYNGIDSINILSEIGLFYNTTNFASDDKSLTRNDGNIQYIALGLRLSKFWAMSVGISPYSRVDYIVNSTDHINGETTSYNVSYTGNGGINKFYIGNSYKLKKNLVFGVNMSAIFGSISRAETAQSSNEIAVYSVEAKQYIKGFYLDYGIQYTLNLKENKLVLGAIYSFGNEINTSSDINIETESLTVSEIDKEDSETFTLPQKIGLGLGFNKKDKWNLGFDYERRDWGVNNFTNPLLNTRNSERLSMGIEFLPQNNSVNKGLKNLYYRFGANYNKSYLVIGDIPINSFAFTAGLGIPMKKTLSMLNVSFEYGQNGTLKDGLMKESYLQINIFVGLGDIWFKRGKYH